MQQPSQKVFIVWVQYHVCMSEERGYTAVNIPSSLIRRARKFVGNEPYGYASLAELVKDALRRRLEELEAQERIRKAAEMGNLK